MPDAISFVIDELYFIHTRFKKKKKKSYHALKIREVTTGQKLYDDDDEKVFKSTRKDISVNRTCL